MSKWILIAVLSLMAPERVSIHAGSVVMHGSSLRVTCRVPRHPDNRLLEIALDPYRSSWRQLDGEDSMVTHDMMFPHVPCEVFRAVCVLTTNEMKQHYAIKDVQVVGCGQ